MKISPNPGQKESFTVDYQEKKNLLINEFCSSGGPNTENKRKRKYREIIGPWEITKKER